MILQYNMTVGLMTVHTAISINFQWALLVHIFCGLWWITEELQKPLYIKAISFSELVPKSPKDFRKQQKFFFLKKVCFRICNKNNNNNNNENRGVYISYVYCTVHHHDSWIKIDQLMSLALFFCCSTCFEW